MYSSKHLDKIQIGNLPETAMQFRDFDNVLCIQMQQIDKSKDCTLTCWIKVALHPVGTVTQVVKDLGSNSQGLDMLDRYIGSKMATVKNMNHPKYGLDLSTYITSCNRRSCAALGRVMIAMIALRLQGDDDVENVYTQMHLFDLKIGGSKTSDVRTFVGNIRYVIQHISVTSRIEKKMLYTWYLRNIRHWPLLARRIDDHDESPLKSEERTFQWLWRKTNEKLTTLDRASNTENITANLDHAVGKTHLNPNASVPGMPAGKGKGKEEKKGKGKGKKDKGKGKGKKAKGKGKGKKGKGKGKEPALAAPLPKAPAPKATPKPAPAPAPKSVPALTISPKKPGEMTDAQKAKTPCRFQVSGRCTNPNCAFSHDPVKIKQMRGASGLTANVLRTISSAMPAVSQDANSKAGKPQPSKATLKRMERRERSLARKAVPAGVAAPQDQAGSSAQQLGNILNLTGQR